MSKLNIGIMGCAAIAERSMIPAIQNTDSWNLVAVASRNLDKAKILAGKFGCEAVEGYQTLLDRNDIDAVYMPLPTGLHLEWCVKTLEAGKHVLAEKSIAYNYASAQQMIHLARSKNLLIMEDFMFQYHSQHQFVFNLLKTGEIGEIRVFRASFGFPPLPEGNFRYDDKIGGGALLDAAGYVVRSVQFVLGDDFEVKAATLKFDQSKGTNTYGAAFLDNGSGVSAQISFGFDHYYQANYEIWGSKGRILADRAFTPRPDFSPTIIVEKQDFRQEYRMEPDDHFIGSVKEFYRAITENDHEKHYRQVLVQSKALDDIRRLSAL